MAVETVLSSSLTLRNQNPRALNDQRLNAGRVRHSRGVVAVAATASSTSTYRFFQVPAHAVPISLRLSCPDIGTTMTADFGIYRTTRDGGAVVDADLFASAVDIHGGALAKSEILRESTTITVALSEQAIWQFTALTVDPGYSYDVVMTATADNDGTAASVLLEMDWTVS